MSRPYGRLRMQKFIREDLARRADTTDVRHLLLLTRIKGAFAAIPEADGCIFPTFDPGSHTITLCLISLHHSCANIPFCHFYLSKSRPVTTLHNSALTDACPSRLQGEKPLAQQSLNRSSHAYDKHLLSKIGKSNSPPSYHGYGTTDSSPSATRLSPLDPDRTRPERLIVADSSSASFDHVSRWVASPTSAAMSPGAGQGWRDYQMDFRSSSVHSSAPSSAIDPEFHPRLRDYLRISNRGSLSGSEDPISLPNRSKWGNYDHSSDRETDSEFPIEETGGLRKLNLADSITSATNGFASSQQGMKRRALSPPVDTFQEDKLSIRTINSGTGPFQKSYANQSSSSRFHPNHGSVSSTSSAGLRDNSYASSIGPSAAGSSMTSISSVDRHSPGGISPTSETGSNQKSPYIRTISAHPQASLASARPTWKQADAKIVNGVRKMSALCSVQQNSAPSRMTGLYICECCPKKPKKFDTEEDLR